MPTENRVYRLDASNPAGITIPLHPGDAGTVTVTIVSPLRDMLIPLDDLAGWDCLLYAPFDGIKYRPGYNYMELLFIQNGRVVARGSSGVKVAKNAFAFQIPSQRSVLCVFNDVCYSNNYGAVTIGVK